MKLFFRPLALGLLISVFLIAPLYAAEEDESKSQHLAKQLQNPVAALISIPFQNNWASGMGTGKNGTQYLLRLQPVIPVSYNKDYNLIVRPIFSYVDQKDLYGSSRQSGLGDTELELFWSPKTVAPNEAIWGIGSVLLFPTAADTVLGMEKWGIGPAAVVLKQMGGLTYGGLLNHIWSVAGNSSRGNVSATFMEPFLALSNKHGSTVTLLSESTYDWMNNQWTIPVELGVSQILPLFGYYFSAGATGIYNLQSPTNISRWSTRITITLLLPEK
ncbi:MAG: hypothetical protein WCT39_03435 [Candidatus Margulisiibacteriota bacterium]